MKTKHYIYLMLIITSLLSCSNMLAENSDASYTPIIPNNEVLSDPSKTATPQFSIEGGTYNYDIDVEITCSTLGAVIYYTTDGSDPNSYSTQYTGLIEITGCGTDVTINAIAVNNGMPNSNIASSNYNIQYNIPDFSALYGLNTNFGEPSILRTDDCGYIITGFTTYYGEGGMDYWVFKLDHSGNIIWQKAYGGTFDEAIRKQERQTILETDEGGYIFSGYTNSFSTSGYDYWVVKLDSDGNIQWEKAYNRGAYDDIAYSIEKVYNGYVVILLKCTQA